MKLKDIKKFVFIVLDNFEASIVRGETYQKAREFLDSQWYKLTGLSLNNQLEISYRNYVKFSEASGRYQADLQEKEKYPYWMYECDGGLCQEKHNRFNRLVFRWDHPVWNIIYPPNSWNCSCRIRKVALDKVEPIELYVSEEAPLLLELDERFLINPAKDNWQKLFEELLFEEIYNVINKNIKCAEEHH